jgi:hypothetical protein
MGEKGDRAGSVSLLRRCDALVGRQVAQAQPWDWRSGFPSPAARDPEVGDDIHDFWGQLWYIPSSTSRIQLPRVREEERINLVWIRRELWESKEFEALDCFPVGLGDVWDQKPHKLEFAESIWGAGRKKSFLRVVTESMANRGRGRGPRPRNLDEEWMDWSGGGWNQFPPNPYPP